MEAKLSEFHITDFEEVYAIIDKEKQRLHISSVYYSYNITLDLKRDLNEEIEMEIHYKVNAQLETLAHSRIDYEPFLVKSLLRLRERVLMRPVIIEMVKGKPVVVSCPKKV
jgi:hypothetical protein